MASRGTAEGPVVACVVGYRIHTMRRSRLWGKRIGDRNRGSGPVHGTGGGRPSHYRSRTVLAGPCVAQAASPLNDSTSSQRRRSDPLRPPVGSLDLSDLPTAAPISPSGQFAAHPPRPRHQLNRCWAASLRPLRAGRDLGHDAPNAWVRAGAWFFGWRVGGCPTPRSPPSCTSGSPTVKTRVSRVLMKTRAA
jgi:hypothetical protein